MKSVVLLLALFTPSTTGLGVVVLQNFLSVEECDEILTQHQSLTTAPDASFFSDGETTRRNAVKVTSAVKHRLATTLAHVMSSCKLHDEHGNKETCATDQDLLSDWHSNSTWAATDDPDVILTTVKKSTNPHVDHWLNPTTGQREVVHDKVGFIFLEDMKEAYFSHQNEQVVPEKGKLVIFDGDVQHNTILARESTGHHLRLLGPYALTEGHGLLLVGAGGGPTPAPSKMKKSKKKMRPMRK